MTDTPPVTGTSMPLFTKDEFTKRMLQFYPGWTEPEMDDLWTKYQAMQSNTAPEIYTLIGEAIQAGLESSDKIDAISKIVKD